MAGNSTVFGGDERRAVRVLIIDDSEAFLRSARRHLSLEPGIEVVGTATDGDSGVEQCEKLGAEIVLVDLSMPRQNGIETAAALKRLASPPGVVLLTGHDTEVYREEAERAGVDAVLAKWSLAEDAPDLIRRLGAARDPGGSGR